MGRQMSEQVAPFRWVPGQGPDPDAIRRLAEAFPRPSRPMGEAWFMGERQMFPELMGNLDELSNEQIWKPLEEIASGPCCFGQFEEWTDWFHYLLPRLLMRDWRPSAYDPAGLLVTCFTAQHPDSEGAFPHPTFLRDALATLGQHRMSPIFWPGGSVDIEHCLHKYEVMGGTREWYNCGGSLSASLFFCLKYLPEQNIVPWFESLTAIDDPYWTEQIIVWLVGAHPMFIGEVAQPVDLPEYGPYCVGWDWSHALTGNYSGDLREPVVRIPFIPTAKSEALLEAARQWDSGEFFLNFLTDPGLSGVAAETIGLQERFLELYG